LVLEHKGKGAKANEWRLGRPTLIRKRYIHVSQPNTPLHTPVDTESVRSANETVTEEPLTGLAAFAPRTAAEYEALEHQDLLATPDGPMTVAERVRRHRERKRVTGDAPSVTEAHDLGKPMPFAHDVFCRAGLGFSTEWIWRTLLVM